MKFLKLLFAIVLYMLGSYTSVSRAETNVSPAGMVYISAEDVVPADEVVENQVEESDIVKPPSEDQSVIDFILSNWAVLLLGLMGFLKIIVNLTPSTKDNKIFDWLDQIINFIIPNLKKGGGRH